MLRAVDQLAQKVDEPVAIHEPELPEQQAAAPAAIVISPPPCSFAVRGSHANGERHSGLEFVIRMPCVLLLWAPNQLPLSHSDMYQLQWSRL